MASEREIQDRPDVLIIGGGIIGSAAFRECALNGLNVMLVEKGDFGAQISAGSTEMAHGGFRYLMAISDWPLVFESLTERELLSRNAPHLVRPINFYMPVYKGDGTTFDASIPHVPKIPVTAGHPDGLGMIMFEFGMFLYRFFAEQGLKGKGYKADLNEVDYVKLSSAAMLELEPSLKPENLVGGFRFLDRKIEDVERLVIENVLGGLAAAKGKEASTGKGKRTRKNTDVAASALNHTEAVSFKKANDGKIESVLIRDSVVGTEHEIKPKFLINATGIEIDDLIEKIAGGDSDRIRKVSGIHLITPRFWKNDDLQRGYAFWIDKKILFAISKGTDRVLVGTTERDVERREARNHNRTFEADIKEVVEKARRRFEGFEFDIQKHVFYTRVRPLMREKSKTDPKAVSRKDLVSFHGPNCVSMTGKLGPARHLAEIVVRKIFSKLRAGDEYTRTHDILYPGGFEGKSAPYADMKITRHPEVSDSKMIKNLVNRYGSRMEDVLKTADAPDDYKPFSDAPDALPRCAYLFSWKNEMCADLADLFRRTGDSKFLGQGLNTAPSVAGYLAEKLNSPPQWTDDAVKAYTDFIKCRSELVKDE